MQGGIVPATDREVCMAGQATIPTVAMAARPTVVWAWDPMVALAPTMEA